MSTVRDIVDYISDVKYHSFLSVPVECFEGESSGVNVSPEVLMDFLKSHNKFGAEQCVAFISEQHTAQVDDFVQKTLKKQRRKLTQRVWSDCACRELFKINTINAMAGQDLRNVVYGYRIVVKFFRGYPSYAPVMTLSTTIYADEWFFENGDIKETVLKEYLINQ